MTTNPLKALAPAIDPLDRLHDHVNRLNNLRWVAHSGKPYFVAKRQKPDGTTEHYVERTP